MAEIEYELSCCLCSRKHAGTIQVPDGWTESSFYSENELCPDHAIIDEWKSSQCPGCVSGWGDCGLWKGFAYERYPHTVRDTLSEADLRAVACGKCPKRVNGTFFVDSRNGQFGEMNLSKQAPTPAGEALVAAIRQYWKDYPKCAPSYDPRSARPTSGESR